MKDQYVGDVNDYLKYGLLRILGDNGRLRTAVCWMLTPSDGRTDGSKIGYLSLEKKFRHHDPELFDHLKNIMEPGKTRHVAAIERAPILPNTKFFSRIVPDDATGRREFFREVRPAADDCDLLFFDPDNGLEVKSRPYGSKDSSKYLFLEEVSDFAKFAASILVYQHFPREKRAAYIARRARELHDRTGRRISSFVTGNVVFFLLQPQRQPCHLERAVPILSRSWPRCFHAQRHY